MFLVRVTGERLDTAAVIRFEGRLRALVAALPGACALAEGGNGWPLIRCPSRHLCHGRHDGTNRLSMVLMLKQSSG